MTYLLYYYYIKIDLYDITYIIINMSAVKKVCINSSKNYYMGTELSPLHYGLSAEGYDINSIMEGYDKELWIVDVKNNKKVWVKNENLSRITHEEPVIKNILSLYCDAEDIEKMNQLKQKCGKDGSYNLKDIKKFYNVCDDDYDDSRENEADESGKETDCSGADQEEIGKGTAGATGTLSNEEKEDNMSEKTLVLNGAKCIAGGNTCGNTGDENYDGDVDLDDILKGAKGGKGGKGGKSRKGTSSGTQVPSGTVAKTKGAAATAATAAKAIEEGKKADANCVAKDGEKCIANDGDDKKPTDYNIFVKFRLNELKEISTNKKDNFENVKIEWRELKKNKGELKIVMEKAYSWLNQGK
jgi:hypothetical protein